MNAHPEVSGDVGQVMFGAATTLTADGPVEYLLHKSSGRKWVNVDIELETGCGIVPLHLQGEGRRRPRCSGSSGSSCFCCPPIPWRVVLSTDHPNGGSFMSYPELIRLLMDRTYRDDQLKRVNQKLLAGSALADGIAREYTLNEIAIVTRAGPARLLGLATRAISASAPTPTSPSTRRTRSDWSRMFATPRYVVKGGALVVEEGQLRRAPAGRRLHVRPAPIDAIEARTEAFLRSVRDRRVRQLSGRPAARRACADSSAAHDREDSRRPHRRHVRRSVRHAGGARRHHGEEREVGA